MVNSKMIFNSYQQDDYAMSYESAMRGLNTPLYVTPSLLVQEVFSTQGYSELFALYMYRQKIF